MTETTEEAQILVDGNQVWYEGEVTSKSICKLMFEISKIKGSLFVFVSSEGGSVTAGLAFYDFLNANSHRITVVGFDKVCSAATYWLFSKCKTFAFANLQTLFHQIWHDFSDKSEALYSTIKSNEHHHEVINSIFRAKNLDIDWQHRTHVFYAEYLLEHGIVDGLFDESILVVSNEVSNAPSN